MFGERFKKARQFLGYTSQNSIAKEVGLTNHSIRKIELNETKNLNWDYIQYLIKQGINPYFLIGESNEIEGQLIETVSKLEHETLKSDYEDLKEEKEALEKQVSEMIPRSEWEKLKDKIKNYESIFKMLKVEKE